MAALLAVALLLGPAAGARFAMQEEANESAVTLSLPGDPAITAAAAARSSLVELRGDQATLQALNVSRRKAARARKTKEDCPLSVRSKWEQLGLTVAKDKKNGHVYLSCKEDTSTEQKASCVSSECDGEAWCWVKNSCGRVFNRCTKVEKANLQCDPDSDKGDPSDSYATPGESHTSESYKP